MIQTGVIPTCSGTVISEWQRTWAREETAPGMTDILLEHSG